jgi:hypothetical protein
MAGYCGYDVRGASGFCQSPTRGFPKTVRRRLRRQVCLPAPRLEPPGKVVRLEWVALAVGEERQAVNGSSFQNLLQTLMNGNRQHRIGLLLPNENHAVANVLPSESEHIGSALRGEEQQPESQPSLGADGVCAFKCGDVGFGPTVEPA